MAAEEYRGSESHPRNIEGRVDALKVNEDAFFLWGTAAGPHWIRKLI